MSGPKYYNFKFPTNSPEEAAEILSLLSTFQGDGVQATVQNNEIKVVVSSGAFYAGRNQEFIAAQINDAKRLYLKRMIQSEVKRMDRQKTNVRTQSEQIRNRLSAAVEKCNAQISEIQRVYRSPYGDFNLKQYFPQIEELRNKFKFRLMSLDDEMKQRIQNCESYKKEVIGCDSLNELEEKQRYYEEKISLKEITDENSIDAFAAEIAQKKKVLNAYVQFLNEVHKQISSGELKQYEERIKAKASATDPCSASSIEEIIALIEQIKSEHLFHMQTVKLNEDKERAESFTDEQTRALEALKNSLVELSETIRKGAGVNVDYRASGNEILQNCEHIISELSCLQFCKERNRQAIGELRRNLSLKRNALNSSVTYAELSGLQARLESIRKSCLKDEENYEKFSAEIEKYKQLYIKIQGILSAENVSSDGSFDQIIREPADILFSGVDPEGQIEALKGINAQLEQIISETTRRSIAMGIADIARKGKLGEVFVKELKRDGSAHVAYVRGGRERGAIFDVECVDGGRVGILPKGVILSNGKSTLEPEELRKIHTSCQWAEDINSSFQEVGIPNGEYEEMDSSVKEMLYDKRLGYYHIKTEAESIRFLVMSGYSEEEIEKFGYSYHGREESEEDEDMQQTQNSSSRTVS